MAPAPRIVSLIGALALILLSSPPIASAETLTAACSGTTGDAASLAGDVKAAGDLVGPDTVELGKGCTYVLTAVDNNWYGPNGLAPISDEVTIEGNGATIARSADPGTPKFRFFFVGADPTAQGTLGYISPGPGKLTLRDVTLTGGIAKGGSPEGAGGGGGAGFGGALFSQGTVLIENSTLTGDSAEGGSVPNGSTYGGGGGLGSGGFSGEGGGFGEGDFCTSACGGGGGGTGGGGGGGGFAGEQGGFGGGATAGAGGGPASGLGGHGGGGAGGGAGGDGSGGGGANHSFAFTPANGSEFGQGGGVGGGGAGVGGGGGQGSKTSAGHYVTAGGGGFGGGGGASPDDIGGAGGFGGGGGKGDTGGGASGFGGGFGTTTGGGAGAGMGGAIFNMQGQLTIRNSTIASNQAVGGTAAAPDPGKGIGGAVFNLTGSFTAEGSTIAGNAAANGGSAIYNLVYDAAMARTAQTTLHDTIVSGNSGSPELASDKATYISPSPNLGSADANVSDSDLVRTMVVFNTATITGTPLTSDPLLGPLAGNGGTTPTMAPAPGSPALDAGSAGDLVTDQRGLARPSGSGADIGAVEVQAPSITITAPADGASFTQGDAVNAAYSCGADSVASLTACSGPVPSGAALDTSTIGPRTFTVTATDSYGHTSTSSAAYTVVAPPASITPVLSHVKQSHKKWREHGKKRKKRPPIGTSFSFTLNEPARVTFTFKRRAVKAGTLSVAAHEGTNRLKFKGKLSKKRTLKPAHYTLRITATDAAGKPATPRTLKFTIARP